MLSVPREFDQSIVTHLRTGKGQPPKTGEVLGLFSELDQPDIPHFRAAEVDCLKAGKMLGIFCQCG